MECENCEVSLKRPSLATFWSEYHVGGYPSEDTFYFCPDCRKDESVKPEDMLVIHEVSGSG